MFFFCFAFLKKKERKVSSTGESKKETQFELVFLDWLQKYSQSHWVGQLWEREWYEICVESNDWLISEAHSAGLLLIHFERSRFPFLLRQKSMRWEYVSEDMQKKSCVGYFISEDFTTSCCSAVISKAHCDQCHRDHYSSSRHKFH